MNSKAFGKVWLRAVDVIEEYFAMNTICHTGKNILAFALAACLASFGLEDRGKGTMDEGECRMRAGRLLAAVVESASVEARDKALLDLRAAIGESRMMRGITYPRISMALNNAASMDVSLRNALLEILAEAVANDTIDAIRNNCLRFIWEFMSLRRDEEYSGHFVECLEKAYAEGAVAGLQHGRRNIILALDTCNSRMTDEICRKYANKYPSNFEWVSNSEQWCATLAMARRGDVKSVKFLIRLSEADSDYDRLLYIFNDITCVHHKLVVEYLRLYLMSDKRFWDSFCELRGPLEDYSQFYHPVASYAAKALSMMLEGFPAFKDYESPGAIAACRKWMEENPDYKFRK